MNYPDIVTYFTSIPVTPANLIADLLILGIALFFIIRGIKRGFVGTALNLIRPFATILIAFFCCNFVGQLLYNMHLFDALEDSIYESIKNIVTNPSFAEGAEGKEFAGFTGIIGALLAISGNSQLVSDLAGLVMGEEEMLRGVSGAIVSSIAVVVAFIALLFLGSLIVKLIIYLINLLFKLPGLKAVNTVFGCIFGILMAAVVCWLSAYIISFLFGWLGSTLNIPFFAGFGTGEGTYLLQSLSKFNPIQWALQAIADSMVFA